MKKSLLALAVLGAFTSIASAQSSVTLYGRIDQNVTLQDPGKNAAATTNGKLGKSVTKLQEGNVNGLGGSRLGFKGTEDLGSGLKAIFQLEAQLFPDEGRAGNTSTFSSTFNGNPFFSRFAYLGLSHSGLGEIRVGRQESLSRENNVKINDISGESNFNIVENLEGTNGRATRPLFQNFGSRVDNGIRYTTPEFAGIRVSAIVGLGERLTTITGTAPNTVTTKAATYRGLAAVYAAGPLALDLIYEDLRGGAVGNGEYNNVITAGGSYDFGVAKVATAYQHTNNLGGQFAVSSGAGVFAKGTDVDAWNIGVAVPFNAFTFKAQYTGSNISRPAAVGPDLDQAKYGVSLAYSLSKRTTIYATASERSGDNSSYFVRQSEVAMGLAHTF
jgi:predicted porin